MYKYCNFFNNKINNLYSDTFSRIIKVKDDYYVIENEFNNNSPDSSFLLGSWKYDQKLKITKKDSVDECVEISKKYPPIQWNRITMNHKYIHYNLLTHIKNAIKKYNIDVNNISSHILTGPELKKYSFKYNKLMPIIIINVKLNNNKTLSDAIKKFYVYRQHLYTDVLRIRRVFYYKNSGIIEGVTELGSTYHIIIS